MKRAHASRTSASPVSARMPRAIISRTTAASGLSRSFVDTVLGVHGSHLSGIRPGHAGLRGGRIVRDHAILGDFMFRGGQRCRGRGGQLKKCPAMHHFR